MISHSLLAFALTWSVCGVGDLPSAAATPPSDRAAADALIPSLPGLALARRRTTLSAPSEGILLEVRCEEGELVQAGDIVAVLDNRVATAATQLAAAEAEQSAGVLRAESDLRTATSMLARLTQAGERQAASDVEIERARASVEQAEAALRQAQELRAVAQAAYQLELARLEALNLRAPFPGRVARLRSLVGETLTLTKPVLDLVDTSQLRAELYLPMDCYARLENGATYRLLAHAPVEAVVPARLVLKDQDIDPGTQTFRCVFEIDNADGKLPSGFTVRLLADAVTPPVSSASPD